MLLICIFKNPYKIYFKGKNDENEVLLNRSRYAYCIMIILYAYCNIAPSLQYAPANSAALLTHLFPPFQHVLSERLCLSA